MYTLITVLIFIVCILLILIVLVQNSKGGGLASNFQSSNQIMGVRKTTDFLEKATWVLAGALLFLSIMGSAFIPREDLMQERSRVQDQLENAIDPTQVPNFPTTVPEADETEAAPAESDTNQ
ncbi:MAG TPA: preprotein translocase subunit SecG [Mariniphaga sp.]|nr:preprotein translocase subunit SecG [Mariniphaga sp.]